MRGAGARPCRRVARDRHRHRSRVCRRANCGVEVIVDADPGAVRGVVARSELILDSILGTGLRSAPREPQAGAIRAINGSDVPVLSVDVPERPGRHHRRGLRSGSSRRAHVHPHRDEAGLAPGRRAAHAGRRDLGRRHRHAGGRVEPSGAPASRPVSPAGSWCTLRPDLPLDRGADSRLFFDPYSAP